MKRSCCGCGHVFTLKRKVQVSADKSMLLTKPYSCKEVRNMDRDMSLRKVCPQCNTVVHVKRSCCGCGHVFTLKRKVQVSADKSMGKAVKRRRALETVEDTLRRQAQNRTHMASMRASETHEQTLQRQEQDSKHD